MEEKEIPIEKLEVDLVDSITSDMLLQLGTDASESILDVILEEGVVNNIPIFGSIYKIGKAGLGLREQFFAKKVLKFLMEIKDVPSTARQKFINELEEEDETGQKAGETLLILLDRLDNIEKPKIIARLLKAKINGKISLIKFLRLSSVVEKAFMPDLKKLSHFKIETGHREDITESLLSLGIIYMSVLSGGSLGEDTDSGSKYALTNLGTELLEFGLLK